jgi:hypothetical protein
MKSDQISFRHLLSVGYVFATLLTLTTACNKYEHNEIPEDLNTKFSRNLDTDVLKSENLDCECDYKVVSLVYTQPPIGCHLETRFRVVESCGAPSNCTFFDIVFGECKVPLLPPSTCYHILTNIPTTWLPFNCKVPSGQYLTFNDFEDIFQGNALCFDCGSEGLTGYATIKIRCKNNTPPTFPLIGCENGYKEVTFDIPIGNTPSSSAPIIFINGGPTCCRPEIAG